MTTAAMSTAARNAASGAIRTHTRETVPEIAEVCSIRLGDGLYGLPIARILEIVGGARPETVPLAPPFVAGLVHYRGDALTTVSARKLLGMAPREDGEPSDLLVVESPNGNFGLIVDSVREVLKASREDFEPSPSTVHERTKSLLAGAYKLKEKLMIMLDPVSIDPIELAKTN